MTARVADTAEREAALDVRASCIVEAPAGSGKTGLLIQRYLKLLATVDDPAEVLALTFTTKATAEMAERILRALRSAAASATATNDFDRLTASLASAVLQRDRALRWNLLERPYLLNIRTIDSLCASIVRSVPFTAGELSGARPTDDPKPLYLRAGHAVMMRFGGDDAVLNRAIETVLMHRDGDLAFCERVLGEMLATRDQWGSLIPLGEHVTEEYLETVTLPRLNDSLRRAVCSTLEEARNGFDEDTLHEIAQIAERHALQPGYKDDPNPLLPCAGRPHAPGATLDDLEHWQAIRRLLLTKDSFRKRLSINDVGTALNKIDAARLKDIIDTAGCEELFLCLDAVGAFGDSVYPADQWNVSKALFRLLEYALVELKLIFATDAVCDFTEVALSARTALSAREGNLQEVLGTRLRHMLVDEMQDTSAGQYTLLEQLTAGWDGSSQTLFLVGDPKQSIYLFRQARVDRFQQCMTDARLGEIPLNVLRLSTNFRSGGDLVEQCNETFRRVFPADHPPDGDVVFHDATAANAASSGEGMVWSVEAIPTVPNDLTENRRRRRGAVRREARATAALLSEARARWNMERQSRLATGDANEFPFRAAVLTRARTHVIEIAKELEKAGLAYRAVDLKPLAEQQEVLDAVAITRALLHPADRIAWLAIVRAPWCGLELAHLHTLAAGDDPKHRKESLRLRFRERGESLPAEAKARLLRTLDVMDGAVRNSGVESLGQRVERTWRSLGGDLYATALQRENVSDYLRVLHGMDAAGEALTLSNLNRRLLRLFARSSHVPDAVDIMTIHRAKGLEWDAVVMPGLHRQPTRDAYAALQWVELPSRGEDGSGDILLAPLPGKGGQAGALLDFIRARKRARGYAEVKRLLYVAITRARTSLHLFAAPTQSTKGKTTATVGTLLEAAWPAAEEHLTVRGTPASQEDQQEPLQLAAAAEIIPFPVPLKAFRLPGIERLPASVDPLARLQATRVHAVEPPPTAKPFERPTGTFGARAVGNAIHAFAERLSGAVAQRMAAGESSAAASHAVAGTIPSWLPAIRATLRTASLPPSVIPRAAATVERALVTMLQSDTGRWLLSAHREAADETSWHTADERRVRLDRSFFAGPTPGALGDNVFWIVDFKTGDRTGPNETDNSRERYLQEQRAEYQPQLETYAEVRQSTLPPGTAIMLGLYYPLMDRLLWWQHGNVTVAAPQPEQAAQFSLFD